MKIFCCSRQPRVMGIKNCIIVGALQCPGKKRSFAELNSLQSFDQQLSVDWRRAGDHPHLEKNCKRERKRSQKSIQCKITLHIASLCIYVPLSPLHVSVLLRFFVEQLIQYKTMTLGVKILVEAGTFCKDIRILPPMYHLI